MEKLLAYTRVCEQVGPDEWDMFLKQIELDESEPISKLLGWMKKFDNAMGHSNFIIQKKEI